MAMVRARRINFECQFDSGMSHVVLLKCFLLLPGLYFEPHEVGCRRERRRLGGNTIFGPEQEGQSVRSIRVRAVTVLKSIFFGLSGFSSSSSLCARAKSSVKHGEEGSVVLITLPLDSGTSPGDGDRQQPFFRALFILVDPSRLRTEKTEEGCLCAQLCLTGPRSTGDEPCSEVDVFRPFIFLEPHQTCLERPGGAGYLLLFNCFLVQSGCEPCIIFMRIF
jgi:hypothetical protein